MKTYLYPAYFRRIASGGFSIDFPDLPGCISAGDDLEEAMHMAKESLSLHLYGLLEETLSIPQPTSPEFVPFEDGAFVVVVEGHPEMVGDEIRNRSVKKTLTIPNWLNEEAERRHINFSKVLQQALREKIGV